MGSEGNHRAFMPPRGQGRQPSSHLGATEHGFSLHLCRRACPCHTAKGLAWGRHGVVLRRVKSWATK